MVATSLTRKVPMRKVAISAVAGLLVAGAALFAFLALGPSGSGASPSVPSLTSLDRLAAQAAAQFSDPQPSSVQVVATTRGLADQVVMGGERNSLFPDSDSVHVIVEHGHFQAFLSPPGRQAPTGTTLDVIVEDATGKPTDYILNDLTPDMSKLTGSPAPIGTP